MTAFLVTGGAGFIGSSIVRKLAGDGHKVRVLDNFSSGRRENLAGIGGDVEIVDGSILDEEALTRALPGIEVVYHEAAIPTVPGSMREPLANHEANATGTLKVLIAARRAGVRRVIYAASSAAYGDSPVMPKLETMAPEPLSPYAVSKLAGEHYCRMFASAYGLETVCLRYFNVFGPRQDPASEYAAVIPKFITAALEGRTPIIYGDGTQSRDFCFIENVVEANLLAATAPDASGLVFNIACGVRTDLNQLIALLGDCLGRKIDARYEPARVGDIMHSLADIGLARAKLGYAGRVGFASGLRQTIDWYREQPLGLSRPAA